MQTLARNCDKHPNLSINLKTGLTTMQYAELDEKGLAEQSSKDLQAYEQCMSDVLNHFTKCDGLMVRGIEQSID